MTIQEKLRHFKAATIEDVRQDSILELETCQKALNDHYEQHTAAKKTEIREKLRLEKENAQREIGKVVSSRQTEIRRQLSNHAEELKSQLFKEAEKHLLSFMAGSEYEKWLLTGIEEAKTAAGDSPLYVSLSPEDKNRISLLESKSGLSLQVAEQSFIGGFRCTIPEKNILIDNSFLSSLTSLKNSFSMNPGGQSHE